MPTAIIRRAILNIEGKAKATAAVPQPKPGVVKTYLQVAANTRKFRMESEQKEEKRLAGFWHNLLLVRSLRRLRQDLVKLIHCLQTGGSGVRIPSRVRRLFLCLFYAQIDQPWPNGSKRARTWLLDLIP